MEIRLIFLYCFIQLCDFLPLLEAHIKVLIVCEETITIQTYFFIAHQMDLLYVIGI